MSIRICFIGAGGIAGYHRASLSKIDDAEIVGIFDVDSAQAEKVASEEGATAYSDYRVMLDEAKPDACYICIPPFAHEGQELECIQRNIPFFVEKPVHLDLEKAQEISEKVKEKNLVTSTGYILRYYDIVEKARRFLSDKTIGLVQGRYFGGVPSEGKKKWLITRAMSGGQLVEQATHTVDMMRYLSGEIVSVFSLKFAGVNARFYPGYDVEDLSVSSFTFASGALGVLSCTWLSSGYQSGVDILGKAFFLSLSGNRLVISEGQKEEIWTSTSEIGVNENKIFLEAVAKKDPSLPKSPYADAVKTLAVTLAAHRSWDEGRAVVPEI